MIFSSTATILDLAMGTILTDGSTLDSFVSHLVLPPLPVKLMTAAIPKWLRRNRQITNIKHVPGTAYAQVRSEIGTSTYSCEEAGVEEPLTATDWQIVSQDQTIYAVGSNLLKMVLRQRDAALSASIFSGTGETTFAANLVTASVPWSTAATATPFKNVQDGKTKTLLACGVTPDSMLISYAGYANLCLTADVQNRVKTIGAFQEGLKMAQTILPTAVVAAAMGLRQIIVAEGTYETAADTGTSVGAFIFPATYALLFKASQNSTNLTEICLGRTFIYDKASEIGALASGMSDNLRGFVLEGYRREDISSDVIRARENVAMTFLNAACASLIKSI